MAIPDQSKLEQKVLALACEDYYGLYEIIWILNSSQSEISKNEKIRIAETVVRLLLNKGFIELFSSEWKTQSHKPIFQTDHQNFLTDDMAWQPGDNYVSFTATKAGEKFRQENKAKL
jgi:hypothetical protein